MPIRARKLLGLMAGTALVVVVPTIACTTVLGDFELQEKLQAAIEAGPPDAPATVDGSSSGTVDSSTPPDTGAPNQQGDAGGGDGGITRPCEQTADCPALATTPSFCAIAKCTNKTCVYSAQDKDGDGHPMIGCVATDKTPTPGDDCADDDPTVVPGGPCNKDENGNVIVFPNGQPAGLCQNGAWTCQGTRPVCQGTVGPAPAEDCARKNDANCNGVADDGCECTIGAVDPTCGNVDNLPAPCQKGTRTCLGPPAAWGPCTGNIEPQARTCSSPADNDCANGPDNSEPACQCPGGVPLGGTQGCTVPNAKGACAVGTHACVTSPDGLSAVFTPCTGAPPALKNCASTEDLDCNGTPDELDVGCGTPCRDTASGASVAATQKFTAKMWGCAGTWTYPARAQACGNGATVCSAGPWVNAVNVAGSKKPLRQYWLQDPLYYYGGGYGANICTASTASGSYCDQPMRVCILGPGGQTTIDPDGNRCNWTGCALNTSGPNHYLGGCSGNNTAGALCCLP